MSRPYEPPVFDAPVDLDLSRNEGLPRVDAVSFTGDELGSLTSRYPDTTRLRDLIATRHQVPVGRVLVTAGGDDALFRCFLASAGGTVVTTTPSFEMIRRYTEQVGSTLHEVPWWDGDFPIADFLEDATTDPEMAVIVSPNNPTGGVITQVDLRKAAGAFPLLVLDAAYADFADEDLTDIALELGNVVVIRTLSKAFGLAGLRVGYLLGPEDLVTAIGAFGSPYSVSALSAALAGQALSAGKDAGFIEEVSSQRDDLVVLLSDLGCGPLRSQGNFVLAADVDPGWLVPAVASLGIGLRRFPGRPDLSRCVRITVPGDQSRYRRLEDTLRSVLAPEALVFDIDGVLVDVRASYDTAVIETAALFGVRVDVGDVAAAKARGNASDDWQLTKTLCSAAGVDVSLDAVKEQFEWIYQGRDETAGLKTLETLLVDRMMLERLSERLRLAVVTGRPGGDAGEFLDRFELASCFDVIITRDDAPSKPDPAPVRLALQRLGVQRAWMLGDTPDDLAAARGAGVVPIGVVAPGDSGSALGGAARVLASVNQIEGVLDVAKS